MRTPAEVRATVVGGVGTGRPPTTEGPALDDFRRVAGRAGGAPPAVADQEPPSCDPARPVRRAGRPAPGGAAAESGAVAAGGSWPTPRRATTRSTARRGGVTRSWRRSNDACRGPPRTAACCRCSTCVTPWCAPRGGAEAAQGGEEGGDARGSGRASRFAACSRRSPESWTATSLRSGAATGRWPGSACVAWPPWGARSMRAPCTPWRRGGWRITRTAWSWTSSSAVSCATARCCAWPRSR